MQQFGKISYGWVFRDWNGQFVATKCANFLDLLPSIEAEALGIREALSWIKVHGWSKVGVEIDSQLVFNALTNSLIAANSFGILIDDCKALASFLLELDFSFVRKLVNSSTHYLARVGGSMTGSKK